LVHCPGFNFQSLPKLSRIEKSERNKQLKVRVTERKKKKKKKEKEKKTDQVFSGFRDQPIPLGFRHQDREIKVLVGLDKEAEHLVGLVTEAGGEETSFSPAFLDEARDCPDPKFGHIEFWGNLLHVSPDAGAVGLVVLEEVLKALFQLRVKCLLRHLVIQPLAQDLHGLHPNDLFLLLELGFGAPVVLKLRIKGEVALENGTI